MGKKPYDEYVFLMAEVAVEKVLSDGLAKSTWATNHPNAFVELRAYREDMVICIAAAIAPFVPHFDWMQRLKDGGWTEDEETGKISNEAITQDVFDSWDDVLKDVIDASA